MAIIRDAYSKRADYWYSVKDYARAAKDEAMVFRLDPHYTDAYYWCMYFYYRAGDMVKARQVYALLPKSRPQFRSQSQSEKRTAGFYDLIVQTHPDGFIKGFDKDAGIIYERMFKNNRLDGPARDFDDKGHLINAHLNLLMGWSMVIGRSIKRENLINSGHAKMIWPKVRSRSIFPMANSNVRGCMRTVKPMVLLAAIIQMGLWNGKEIIRTVFVTVRRKRITPMVLYGYKRIIH